MGWVPTTPPDLTFTSSAGERVLRFVGDWLVIRLTDRRGVSGAWTPFLRTTVGRARVERERIIRAARNTERGHDEAWVDLPMARENESSWCITVPLAEVGFFRAKPFLVDGQGRQYWPAGEDLGISVHPNDYRTANTLYCAFTRLFGPSRFADQARSEAWEKRLGELDELGFTAIPPSGKLRDLTRQIPHIFDRLGFRILQLLPINPTPTTLARFGRFGSPYAGQDLTAIDPALVELDRRTTGVEQFLELADEVHAKDGKLFLDLVINHTGWGSRLFEEHPEWFLRDADGRFASPGAWGNVWEDLVELKPDGPELWESFASAFLVWCRRGVDGFRCDAGYKVPMPVWRYVVARVRTEFPNTLFLLEGLGGGWWDTEALLTEGGMQWAYSELFQEFTSRQIAGYLDHAIQASQRVGLLVHYSETHDNNRLAVQGRAWSLLRNQLCALTSPNGGYAITTGVEWLATEKVNVHQNSGLRWEAPDHITREIATLNRLLAEHPCFFDGASLERLSPPDSAVYVLLRQSQDRRHAVLIVVNPQDEAPQRARWTLPRATSPDDPRYHFSAWRDLLGQTAPALEVDSDGGCFSEIPPCTAYCLAPADDYEIAQGQAYRASSSRRAWAMQRAGEIDEATCLALARARGIAEAVEQDPAGFLAMLTRPFEPEPDNPAFDCTRRTAELRRRGDYLPVTEWSESDTSRITLVPAGHWLLIHHPEPFTATCTRGNDFHPMRLESCPVQNGWIAAVAPNGGLGHSRLNLRTRRSPAASFTGALHFLNPPTPVQALGSVSAQPAPAQLLPNQLVLLTNGRGGMCRVRLDLGRIESKYDCLLGANLHPSLPVDRHVLVKRLRLWSNANRFLTPLDFHNLSDFQLEPIPRWAFRAFAGAGSNIPVEVSMSMDAFANTVRVRLHRPRHEHADLFPLVLTARLDLEDRSFHSETRRGPGADDHFRRHTSALKNPAGFRFKPAEDRPLTAFCATGDYHEAPEWSENIPHPHEASRGQTASGDAFSPGWFEMALEPGASAELVITAESVPETALALAENRLSNTPPLNVTPGRSRFFSRLARAADQFRARRGEGETVIAGYPWFLDWGRDSLIAARGLISCGRTEEVLNLLCTFARFEAGGTLPNSIHAQDASNRDTSDAPLWLGVVVEELASACAKSTNPTDVLAVPVHPRGRRMVEVLESTATHYLRGTANGIRVDPDSGLVWSPGHFTWMDTNYPAGTPREGYPIEIQALWVRLLRQLAMAEGTKDPSHWRAWAEKAAASLEGLFWLERKGWYADVLRAPAGVSAQAAHIDDALRSNMILAIALGTLGSSEGGRVRSRRAVQAATRHLVVPGALRSLAPLRVELPLPVKGHDGRLLNDPHHPYWGHYEGDEDTRRKPAYHNGTAWCWTFPSFCEAMLRAWPDDPQARSAARSYLDSSELRLDEGCLGQLPEILDGNAPHRARGCDAQAWSVTEAARVLSLFES